MENINEAKSHKPFYFYHMTDKNNKIDKLGLISPEYMYQHNMDKELQLSYDKYRGRLVSGWGIYPGRDPDSLTNEEIYNGLKQFRANKHGGTGNDEIYFFRYPPYRDLHPQIRSLLNDRVYYRIDINDPALKPYIKIIHWGWKDSHTDNEELKRNWYEKVSVDKYFDQFNPKKQPLFSTLWHIKIVTTKGYIPAKFVERIETPNTREDVKRLEGEIIQEGTYNNLSILDINRNKSESIKYLKSKHSKYTKYIDNYNGEIIIDRDKDIIVGQVFVGKSGKDKGFITGLWVRDSYRKCGLGKKLLEDAIKKYNGIDLTVSKDNDIAINLYKAHGFVNIKYNNNDYYWMKLESKISKDDVLEEVYNESYTPNTDYMKSLEESSYPDNIPDDIVTLSKELNSYDYGYIVNGKLADSSDDFFNDYRSLSISEFEKYKVGVCWDYVHYEANWFKSHRYKYETFYIQVQDEDGDCPSHTYLVFYLPGSNKPYYFEASWKKYRGIEQFSSISKLHDTIKKRHIEDAESKCDPKTYINAKYDAASKSLEHIGCGEFMVKASNGRVRLSESINVKLPGLDIYYNSEYLEERYIGKMNDIYYNKDKFDSGEINLCFITGHSGSGKSTMARSMKKDNIEVYELDDVVYNKESFTMENLKEYGDLIYSFFNGPGKKYYFTKEDVDFGRARSIEAYDEKLIKDFIKYTITYAKSHKNNKFVVEGLWLLDFIEPELLKDYAVYIKGTSLLRSTIRAANRDSDYEKENGNSKLMGWIGRVRRITSFADCEKNLRKYQTYFSKLSCNESSIKRSEVNTSDFGLPDLRKYPMPDEDHVLSAIKFFNYVSPANEKELAKNIKKKMKQYNISPDRVGKKNRLRKYLTEDTDIIQELYFDSLDYTPILVFDIGDVLVYYKKKMIDAICSNKAIKYGEELWDYIIDTFNKNSKYLDYCSYNDYVKYMTNNAPTHLKQYITTALSIDIDNGAKFDYTDSLLRNLKSNGYPIYYLSNWSKWSRDALIKNGTFDFLKYFDGGIFSCDCGISKPDERIYKKLFEKYNLNPGHTIFFDDRYENISAAINCGMNGILFNHEYTPQWIKDYFLK